jgi:hypothetical protein
MARGCGYRSITACVEQAAAATAGYFGLTKVFR